MFATEIRKRRIEGVQSRRRRRHLDEIFVKVNGERRHLWRAVDHEGEVLEWVVTTIDDRKAALKFLRKAMRKHGPPEVAVTDRLRPCGAALKDIGNGDHHDSGRWQNNRAETSQPSFRRREPAMPRLRRTRSLQTFAGVHAHFDQKRSLGARANVKLNHIAAVSERRRLCSG